ncbi:MAG: hypothetical protein HY060_14620 [Proteobacteria bacterium]|nr:hypothetical protein [Pseudomonadota bacterium]
MRDRPDAGALAELADRAARAGASPDAVAFARAIIAREAAAGEAPVAAWAARLAALSTAPERDPATLERRLAGELRAGGLDHGPRRDAVRAHLIATVRAKLAEVDPTLVATWPLLDAGCER